MDLSTALLLLALIIIVMRADEAVIAWRRDRKR